MVKLFGTTIAETVNAFGAVHLGGEQTSATKEDRTKAIGRIIISILMVFLAAYLFMINKEAPAGTITGALVGYWIK